MAKFSHQFFLNNSWWRVWFPADMDKHEAEGFAESHIVNGYKLLDGLTLERLECSNRHCDCKSSDDSKCWIPVP